MKPRAAHRPARPPRAAPPARRSVAALLACLALGAGWGGGMASPGASGAPVGVSAVRPALAASPRSPVSAGSPVSPVPPAQAAGRPPAAGVAAAALHAARPASPASPAAELLTTPPPALPRPARRIVSLAPHLTELVFAAGGGSRLVGVGRYSDYPPQARGLPVVGDAFAINLEAVARLQPDLILVWQSALPPRQRERLRRLGVPVWESEIHTVEELAATLRALGRLMGTPQGDTAAAALLARWSALKQTYGARAPVRVFYQVWDAPLMTINDRHLIGSAIRACGGVNPFGSLPPLTPTVSWEAAVQADPQLVAAAMVELGLLRRSWARFAQVDAVRNGQVVGLPADLLTRMGPRFIDGAQALCAAIDAARRAAAP